MGWCTWLDNRNLWAEYSSNDMKAKMQRYWRKTASHSLTKSNVWNLNYLGNQQLVNLARTPICVSSNVAWGRNTSISQALSLFSHIKFLPALLHLSWTRFWGVGDTKESLGILPTTVVRESPHTEQQKILEHWPTTVCATFLWQSKKLSFSRTDWQLVDMPVVLGSLHWGH